MSDESTAWLDVDVILGAAELAQEADKALAAGNRERCTQLIAKLYKFLDEHFAPLTRGNRARHNLSPSALAN